MLKNSEQWGYCRHWSLAESEMKRELLSLEALQCLLLTPDSPHLRPHCLAPPPSAVTGQPLSRDP